MMGAFFKGDNMYHISNNKFYNFNDTLYSK